MGQTEKMSLELALKEVESWLDQKNYPKSKREKNKDQIESLADFICDGTIAIETDGTIIHTLVDPIKDADTGDIVKDELTYKARINWKQIKPYMRSIKTEDGLGIVNAHVAALTSQSLSVIESLDSNDLSVGRAIATFFL